MYIKLKDFVCSFRGSISAVSADITKLGEIMSINRRHKK